MHTREPTTETKISINSKKNPKRFSYNHFEDLREIARNDSWKGRNKEESQSQSPSPSPSQRAVASLRSSLSPSTSTPSPKRSPVRRPCCPPPPPSAKRGRRTKVHDVGEEGYRNDAVLSQEDSKRRHFIYFFCSTS